ncbi:shikimate dehydrogenase [Rubrobacter calidifluminis]|uniref:shikimate dehydrogenase n=1 Tax=Rubrobacter calidifluminis TaxID=1392640 RepID=UPI00235F8B6D|nr:shikimate dehydrogenase [Rubrobacter calidifluminis]
MGVIGHPIAHSLSPQMHNASFASRRLDYVYVAMDVAPERLGEAVRGLGALGFRGFNVTIPHKEEIIRFLDDLDGSAEHTGAVNTVVLEGGRARGYNTDGFGFLESCREAGVDLAGEQVLILGAGGAASAIADAALRAGAEALVIANRTPRRAKSLAGRLVAAHPGARVSACGLETLDGACGGAGVLVNTTPVGMKDGDPLPFPEESLRSKVVCDIVYRGGEETPLLETARRLGARVVRGRRMLLYQGVRAQRLWTGVEPDVEAMGQALEGEIEDPDSRG